MWVPTSPLVVKPQTKNVADSSQKSRDLLPSASAEKAVLSGLPSSRVSTGWSASAPKGTVPTSEGCSGNRKKTSGIRNAIAAATQITTGCQPWSWAIADKTGMKISVPVEVEAANSPITNPRLVTNQRLTMTADSTLVMQPEPMPETTPQVSTNSQVCVMNRLAVEDRPIMPKAIIMVAGM